MTTENNRPERQPAKEAVVNNKFPNSNLSDKYRGNKKTGLVIELGKEVVLKEIPAQQIKATSIEVISMMDDPAAKTVTVRTNSLLGTVVLWEGDAYDVIGDWTNEDVKTRLIELIETKK